MVRALIFVCCLPLPIALATNDSQAQDKPAGGGRLERVKRWRINLAYDEPKEFVSKLAELKVEVGARQKDGRFQMFTDLTKSPAEYREIDITAFQKYAREKQCLWLVSNDDATRANFREGTGVAETPVKLFIFLPQDLEKEIVKFEEKLYDLTEAQIKAKKIVTHFEVSRKGDAWDFKVTQSYLDPSLQYEK
jgi:hypothetical protein